MSSTYTYLLGCAETGQALLIDPVVNAPSTAISASCKELGLRLAGHFALPAG